MATKDGKKTGGRSKGKPNKRTEKAREIVDAHNYGAIKELIRIARIAEKEYDRCAEVFDAIQDKRAVLEMVPLSQSEAVSYLKLMQKSAAEIAPYIHPRLKAISFQDGEGNDIQTFAELIAASVDRKNAITKK